MILSTLKFICDPIIGCVPALLIFSANSKAPHKFEVSHKPIALILLLLQYSASSSIFTAPSHMEYCE